MNNMELTIDDQFKKLLPPLSKEQKEELEKKLIKEGVRDPLVAWEVPNGKLILLDGHHRYEIAKKNDLKYQVAIMKFNSRKEAEAWVYENQLMRRNLNDAEQEHYREMTNQCKAYYIGKRYETEKAISVDRDKDTGKFSPSPQNEDTVKGRTSERIARETGVSHSYVERAEQFAKALDSTTDVDPEFRDDVLTGKVKVTNKEVIEVGETKDAEKKKEMVQELRKPKSERAINVHKLSDALEGIRQNAENVFDEQFKNMFAHGDESRRCEVCKRILPLDMFSDDTHLFRCRQCATQLKRDSEGSKTMPETLDPNIPTTITGEDVINEFRLIVDRFLWSLKNALEINKPNREEWTDHKIILEINACIDKMNEIKKEIKNETRRESI